MNKTLLNAFNVQIKSELYSAYLYLEMANYCTHINMKGGSHWMRLQVKEEVTHAIKMMDYLLTRKEKVNLFSIPKPLVKLNSLRAVFEKTLAHEKKVTALIHNLSRLAGKLNDKHAHKFMQWYIDEQVEEEENAEKILKLFKNNASAIDRILLKRK